MELVPPPYGVLVHEMAIGAARLVDLGRLTGRTQTFPL